MYVMANNGIDLAADNLALRPMNVPALKLGSGPRF
jgi:hypothetical protein